MARAQAGVPVCARGTIAVTTGTGWKAITTLAALGVKGRITAVRIRLATGGPITTASFYVLDSARSDGSGTPDDLDVVYASTGVACTASATAASLSDNVEVDGGGWYDVATDGDLAIALNVTAVSGAGASDLEYAIDAVVNAVNAGRTA